MRVSDVLVSALAVTGCFAPVYDDRCGPEIRVTTAMGSLADSSGTRDVLGFVQVELQEVRPDTILARIAMYGVPRPGDSVGGPLRGHVVSAHLEDRAGSFAEAPPVPPASVDFLGPGLIRIDDPALLERARAAFLDNTATLVIRSDLAGREQLQARLVLYWVDGWGRAHCS
jgi:hypothetical protein